MRSLLVLMLLTAPALADPAKSAESMHSDDCARARAQKKTCVLDMKGEDLKGDGVTPDGSTVRVVETTKQPSLIKLRKDFIVEIIRSAEDL
jgi:hypothetical protein